MKALWASLALATLFTCFGCASARRTATERDERLDGVTLIDPSGTCHPECMAQAAAELKAKMEAQNARLGVIKEETVGR